MISYDKALVLKQELEKEYQVRHQDHQRLREYWHGRYWESFNKSSSGIASLFKDIHRGTDGHTPDYKIVHNIIQEVCLKYQSFLSPLPMIRVYREPNRKHGAIQATKKERYLYGLWNQRPMSMAQALNRMAWYLPLMGDCFLGSFPDFDNKTIRPLVRSPESAFPIPSYDGQQLDGVIFEWEESQAAVMRRFPKYDPDAGKARFALKRKQKNPKVKILEYSDDKEFRRWIDGQEVNGVEHNYGFNLFDQLGFINVPDEPWNHGAVEQAFTMQEAENVMRSLLLQAVLENIFPTYVLIDPQKAPEELDKGPGAVWGVNAGGDVKTLSPPLQALPVQQGFLEANERAIKSQTSMPEASMGQLQGGMTHVSGRAINELQGAGTGSTIEMVQGLGIGAGMVSWNEKAICMGRKIFADETINLAGVETGGVFDLNPRAFSISLKGSELVGSVRNEVVFSPALDMHSKLIQGLQAMGAGLVSKEHVRNQLNIPDSKAMDEEILGERLQDIVMLAIETEVTAAPTAENAVSAEERGMAILAGRTPQMAAAGSLAPAAPMPPGGPPPPSPGGPPVAPMPGGGQIMAPALEMPPGAPLPGAAPPQAGPPSADLVTLDQAVQVLQAIEVSGRVFLVGEIVDGQTDDVVEIALTEPSDRQLIVDQAPFPVSFTTVQAEPRERYVEVTPGAVPEPQGEDVDLDAILA